MRVGNVAAQVALAAVKLQTQTHAAARIELRAQTQTGVVRVAKLAAPVVIAETHAHPFNFRHVHKNFGVKAVAGIICPRRQALGVRQSKITVRRYLAQPRFDLAADRPPPKTAGVRVLFVIQKCVNAAKQLFAKLINNPAVENTRVQTGVNAVADIAAHLPADGVVVALAQSPQRFNAAAGIALAKPGAKVNARPPDKRQTLNKRARQRPRQRRFNIGDNGKRRIAKSPGNAPPPNLPPLAHVKLLAVAKAQKHIPHFPAARQRPDNNIPQPPPMRIPHFPNNIRPKTPRPPNPGAGVTTARKAINLPVPQPFPVKKPFGSPPAINWGPITVRPRSVGNIPMHAQRKQRDNGNPAKGKPQTPARRHG